MKYLALSLAVLAVGAATPAAAESWHPFSSSPNNVFMADVDSIVENGAVKSVRVATVPRRREAGDYSHSIEIYEINCGASSWRTAGLVEYGPDGAEAGRYPEEGSPFEPVRPRTAPGYISDIVCKGSRAQPPIWTTVKDFIDAGRP